MIAGALFKLFDYIATHKWAQYVLIGLAIFATAGFYLAFRDNGVRKRAKLEQDKATAEELTRVSETRREITQENTDAAIRADEAVADLPRVTTTDGLRKHSKAVSDELLGSSPRGDG